MARQTVNESTVKPLTDAALHGITRALASVGRAFICLDPEFRILHASRLLDRFLGADVSQELLGRRIEELFGNELFGEEGTLRQVLENGQMREGWRATLNVAGHQARPVSITTAPMVSDNSEICDPQVRYLILLRPAEEECACANALSSCSDVVACSPAMQRIFRMVEALQASEASVLITGESGTGKEVVARAIHHNSTRSKGPFVALNCAALPAELLESELFGHVRGAFTGAIRDRVGRFELANEGTLFLDEIGDLPAPLQVKLLRVLQERQFERVGENKTRTSKARIIAATNMDLKEALHRGRFREDLYYRLCVMPIEVPPLRERREDIAPLITTILQRFTRQQGLVKRISPQAMRVLLDYHWPGNVRELANVVEYAVVVAKGETILPEDLPHELLEHPGRAQARRAKAAHHPATLPAIGRPQEIGTMTTDDLKAILDAHQWRRAEVAITLGVSRSTLWRKMREAGLSHPGRVEKDGAPA